MVLLPHADLEHTQAVAEKLRARMAAEAHPMRDGALDITISLGVAQWAAGETAEAWVQRADQALYRAKQGSRNRVEAG